jgi:hypothetical protein
MKFPQILFKSIYVYPYASRDIQRVLGVDKQCAAHGIYTDACAKVEMWWAFRHFGVPPFKLVTAGTVRYVARLRVHGAIYVTVALDVTRNLTRR